MFEKVREILKQKLFWVIISISLVLFLLLYLKILPNNTNQTTMYTISTLVQSEAAVIAIVITLSLVAVQLVASAYSTRVIEVFRDSPSFWAIVILYILAIICGSNHFNIKR